MLLDQELGDKFIKLHSNCIISCDFMDLCRVISLICIEFDKILHLGI